MGGWPTFAFLVACAGKKPAAPPFAVFERWDSMLHFGLRALRGAEAPLFHGATFVLLVLRKI
jgi:hypothetical protein